ncbi:hypothetical protein TNCV_807671 [Trichonephila clavipes]|nr:hypothetical protein TNCV_807671 [Trichonephila clavipes]
MSPDRQFQLKATKFILENGYIVSMVSRIFEHHIDDFRFWFRSISILREETTGAFLFSCSRFHPPSTQNDFRLDEYLDDEAQFRLNGYVNKQNCRIWSEANPQVYVETPLHSEKLTVWCALWAGGILLQKR